MKLVVWISMEANLWHSFFSKNNRHIFKKGTTNTSGFYLKSDLGSIFYDFLYTVFLESIKNENLQTFKVWKFEECWFSKVWKFESFKDWHFESLIYFKSDQHMISNFQTLKLLILSNFSTNFKLFKLSNFQTFNVSKLTSRIQ